MVVWGTASRHPPDVVLHGLIMLQMMAVIQFEVTAFMQRTAQTCDYLDYNSLFCRQCYFSVFSLVCSVFSLLPACKGLYNIAFWTPEKNKTSIANHLFLCVLLSLFTGENQIMSNSFLVVLGFVISEIES